MSARPPRPAAAFGDQEHPMVEAIARRVVELLLEAGAAPAGELVGPAALARLLGVSVDTVYRHADELGAQVVGGERGRGRPLRFDPERAAEAWATGRSPSEQSQESRRRSSKRTERRLSPRDSGSDGGLLPFRGRREGR